jgi:Helix-turn-helix domain
MSGFWRNHPATPNQQQLPFDPKRKRRSQPTQADVLIGLLREARANRRPLELPAIMRAGIAQHGARFKEIRNQGFQVENEMERTADGAIMSRYWLRHDPERDGAQ